MEKEILEQPTEKLSEMDQAKKDTGESLRILVSVIIFVLGAAWVYIASPETTKSHPAVVGTASQAALQTELEEKVMPVEGVVLPVVWGDLGAKLVDSGVINAEKFKALYDQRGVFTDEYKDLLLGQNDSQLKITANNAGYLLNLFWALGLANKNPILETGEMVNPAYGGAGNFASTGGWTLAQGNSMDYYSRHVFFELTPEQQALVEKVSRGIYRPCCNNSTHFPDCNHGLAMLGLLELMASQGVSEEKMWKTALTVNSYWFPDTYTTIARYFSLQGTDWNEVDPQEVLGFSYSSAEGYGRVLASVQPLPTAGGASCGA